MRKSIVLTGLFVIFCSAAASAADWKLDPVPETIVWTGATDGNWDTTTINWKTVPGGVPIAFSNGDHVIFDNDGNNPNITIQGGGVAPGSATFANTLAKAYVLSGGAIVGNGGVVKQGDGAVTISTTGNAYAGKTIISSGMLIVTTAGALGAADGIGTTEIASGATLAFSGGLDYAAAEQVAVSGSGVGGGAILNINGDNTFGGLVVATAATTFGSTSGKLIFTRSVSGNHAKTFSGAGDIELTGVLSGSGGFVKDGTGKLIFSGGNANTYVGTAFVNAGILELRKADGLLAINDSLIVGDGLGGAESDVVRFFGDGQLRAATSISVTVTESGLLDLNGFSGAVSKTLSLSGGKILTGNGTLSMSGGAVITASGSGKTSGIFGNFAPYAGPAPVFNVVDANAVLEIGALVTSWGTCVKSGAGTLVFSGDADNNISGLNVNVGTVRLNKTPGRHAIAGGITVGDNSGGVAAQQLILSAADQIRDSQWVTVSSSGLFDLNGSGDTFSRLTLTSGVAGGAQVTTGSGVLTLTENVTLAVNGSGTVGATIAGNLALGSTARTFDVADGEAADDLTISAIISGAAGAGLTKIGAGRLTLVSAAAFTGPTTIQVGTFSLKNNGSLLHSSAYNVFGGTLLLDESGTTLGNRLAGGVPVKLNAGTLALQGKDDAASLQTVGEIVLAGGVSTLNNQPGGGTGSAKLTGARLLPTTGALLNCSGAIGTAENQIRFTLPPTLTNGILPYAAVTGADFATYNAFGLAAFGAYYTGIIDNASAGDNVKVTADDLVTIPNKIINSLTIVGDNVRVTGAAGVKLTLTSGALSASGADIQVSVPTLNLGAGAGTVSVGSGAAEIGGVVQSGSLSKNGAGVLTLAAANQYAGETFVNQGILVVKADGALGTASSGTIVAAGATLAIQGGINYATAEPLTVAAGGAFGSLGGNNAWAGNIAASGALTITCTQDLLTLGGEINNSGHLLTFAGAGDVTVSGAIFGSGGLTKDGAGVLTVANSGNDWLGATIVAGGVLRCGNDHVIPDNNLTLALGTTLDLNGCAETVGALTMTDASVTTGAGTLTLGGNLTSLASAATSTISGKLSLGEVNRTFAVADGAASDDLVVSAIISGANGVGFTKTGAGVLVLAGDVVNTYSGSTLINDGTLSVRKDGALGLADGGTSVASEKSLLIEGGVLYTVTEPVTLNGGNFLGNGDNRFAGSIVLGAASGIGATAGTLTLTDVISCGSYAPTFKGAGITEVLGAISGSGGLVKTETGMLILSNDGNNYSGATVLGGGVLRLGVSNAVPTAGVVSWIGNAVLDLNDKDLTVAGLSNETGSDSRGVQFGNGGVNTLTINNASNHTYLGVFSAVADGGDKVVKTGGGTLTLGRASGTFPGEFEVLAGTLSVTANGAMGNTSGGTKIADGATLNVGGSYTNAEPLIIAGLGVGDVGALKSSGNFTFGGPITLAANATVGTPTHNLTLTGGIDNAGFALTFDVVNSLTIGTTKITGAGGLTKIGTGTLTLSVAGDYEGLTHINAGTVSANASGALGSATAGTIVADGATLNIGGANHSAPEPVTVNGNGVGGIGALKNSGGYSFAGPVTLGSDALIASASNTFALSGGIDVGDHELTLGGTHSLTVSGAIVGTGNVVKVGTGTTTLSSANGHLGTTTVNEGVLSVSTNGALGDVGQGTIVNSGGTLNVAVVYSAVEPVTINGTGFGGIGALKNSTTTASFAGPVMLGSAALIASASNTFSLNGEINTSGNSLTFGGGNNLIVNGAIGGAGDVVKIGGGTTTLAAANALGAVTVNAGALQLQHVEAAGGAGILLNGGATLNLRQNDHASFGNHVTLGGSATIDVQRASGSFTGRTLSLGALFIGDQTLTVTGTNSYKLRFSGTTTLAGNAVFNTASADLRLVGAIVEDGATYGFTKNGGNILSVEGDDEAGCGGQVTVNTGTLVVKDVGRLRNVSGFTVAGGALLVDNTGAANHNDRLNDNATLNLAGGTFEFKSQNHADGSSETLGAVTLSAGGSTFTNTKATSGNAVVTSASLNSSGGTVHFTGTFGVPSGSQILFTSAPTLTPAGTGILPYATAVITGGSSGYATYGANGIAVAGTAGGGGGFIDGATNGADVVLNNNDVMSLSRINGAVSPDKGPLNSLSLLTDGKAVSANNGPFVLELAGGALAAHGSWTITADIGVHFGSVEGVIYVASGKTLTILGTIAGTNGLRKTGAGTLVLNAGNSLTGDVTIAAGTIRTAAAAALPVGATVTVLGGATLNLDGFNQTIGSLAGAGTTALGAGALTCGDAGNAVFSGSFTGSGELNKVGAGVLTLSGHSGAFTGAINVNEGTLNVAVSAPGHQALGTAAGVTTVENGAILRFSGAYSTAEPVTLKGTLLGSFAGTTAISVTLGASSATILSETDGFALSGAINTKTVATGGPFDLTFGGANGLTLGGVIGGDGAVAKIGAGTATLSGNNTFTGLTTVGEGILRVTANNALGSVAGGTTVFAGAALLIDGDFNYSAAEPLSLAGTGIGGAGALIGLPGSNNRSFAAMITLSDDAVVSVPTVSDIWTLSGVVSGGAGNDLTKIGDGTLSLSGANDYEGATVIAAGVLRLASAGALGAGSAGTTTSAGASLEIAASGSLEPLTLNGAGVGGAGALYKINNGASYSFGGAITLGSAAKTVSSFAGATLTLTGGVMTAGFTMTFDGAGNTTVSASGIRGVGGLTKDGIGTLTLAASGDYFGATLVKDGILSVSADGALGAADGWTIVADGATLNFGASYAAAEPVIINGVGFGGVGALKNSASSTFGGPIWLASASTVAAAAGNFVLDGSVQNAGFELTTAGGGNLMLGGVLSGTGNLVKTGSGVLTLANVNDYSGSTTIVSGDLRVGSDYALGSDRKSVV